MEKYEDFKSCLNDIEKFLLSSDNLSLDHFSEKIKRAEELNEKIESQFETDFNLMKNDQIVDLITKYQSKLIQESNYLITFYSKFLLSNMNLVSDKRKNMCVPNLKDMVGFYELKTYFDSINFENDHDFRKFNAFIYGPSGSGKMSFLVWYFLKRRFLSPESSVKVFLIDFLKNDENEMEFDQILKSINILIDRNNDLSAIILIKNCELLFNFDNETAKSYKYRQIGNLIYQSNNKNETNQKCFFILISNEPWLLNPALINCFKNKFYISYLTAEQISEMFQKIITNYIKIKNAWILKDDLNNFISKSELVDFIVNYQTNSRFNSKIIFKLVLEMFDKAKIYMTEKLETKLNELNLTMSDYKEYISNEEKANNSIKSWKLLRKRFSLIREFNNNISNFSRRESRLSTSSRNNSILVSSSTLTSNHIQNYPNLFGMLKSDLWKENFRDLKENLNSHVINFLKDNHIENNERKFHEINK